MKKCQEVYQKNANLGDWMGDEVKHDFTIIMCDELGTKYKICSHCRGKEIKK